MTGERPPADATSLLVPVHLDAWVVDASNQEAVSWYLPDYQKLQEFQSPMPDAFDVSSGKPAVGVHLHWALPDALTHGTTAGDSAPLDFPLVPNRWLVARFDGGDAKLWVVESDRLTDADAPSGSPFLDPFAPTAMAAEPGQPTRFEVRERRLGASYTIEEWEARGDPDGPLHLRAVGPGNVAFAAYAPTVQDVFAFVDTEPAAAGGTREYTYLVVGWYSDVDRADPLRGVTSYDDAHWPGESAWAAQTPTERFTTVMAALRWSVGGDPGDAPPSTSLYHGAVVGVKWPFTTLGNAGVDKDAVRVAVGTTGVDALAALVQAYARTQAGSDPSPDDAWLAAGETLAALIEAAAHDALADYGSPGGAALVDQRVRDSWFGAADGGMTWDVVAATPDEGGEPAAGIPTGAGVEPQLADLQEAQARMDEAERTLSTRRQALYGFWLRIGRANSFGFGEAPHTTPPWRDLKAFMEGDLYPQLVNEVWDLACEVERMRASLPDPADSTAATRWADDHWTITDAGGEPTTLSGLGLELKASALPRFFHPTDPVVLVSGVNRARKHGEDGRLNADGTLTCRLPGATISALRLEGAGEVRADQVSKAAGQLERSGRIPAVAALAAELAVADPTNAQAIADAGGADPGAVAAAIGDLLGGAPDPTQWLGTPPAAFALRAWDQAWAPLFLEWEVDFHPTGAGQGQERRFELTDWAFDGTDFRWNGTGYDPGYSIGYRGRTLLTPQAPLTFGAKLADYLQGAPGIDTAQVEQLLSAIDDWDVLSQTLSGLGDQIGTLLSGETFPPPPAEGTDLPCPRPSEGGSPPEPALLIGDAYRNAPMLQGTGADVNYFHPVRGGLLHVARLQVVDAFGQTVSLSDPNSPTGFVPIVARGLQPDRLVPGLPPGTAQLRPRVGQAARLDLHLGQGPAGAPVNGWLLPNHIDRAIAVYDATGTMLGEVRPADAPYNWRPRPGPGGSEPPPRTPADIPEPALRQVVSSITAQPAAAIDELLTTIDETLWMVDPLGGRKDQFLSVLIGRPLAVVQATVGLSLLGDPAFNQLWDFTAEPSDSPPPAYRWRRDTGNVGDLEFPVRLGELELPGDGLLGYWLPDGGYARFYAAHASAGSAQGDGYIRPIVRRGDDLVAHYQGDIALRMGGDSVAATLLVDPRGAVHAHAGLLPVTSAALPAGLVEDLMKRLALTFGAGPVVADRVAPRMPLPARRQAAWQWLEAVPGGWSEEPVLDADEIARFPAARPELREGWLGFTGAEEEGG